MTSLQLLDVQEHDERMLMASVEVVDDDGNTVKMASFFPKDTFEWRVAEYGLDPEDHDTLIDVVLFEGMVHASGELSPEETLHYAPTRDHAREALLGAVRARKATSDSKRRAAAGGKAKEDPEAAPRARMRDLWLMDPEVIAAKRAFVDDIREGLRLSDRPNGTRPAPSLADERAAAFHQAIAMRRGNAANADR